MSVNTQRLSAMIDSLNSGSSEDDLLSVRQTVSPAKTSQPLKSPTVDESPTSFNNRSSMISTYSGVVQEGIEVSYVVKKAIVSSPLKNEAQLKPKLPDLPSEETLRKTSLANRSISHSNSTGNLIVNNLPDGKPVERSSSTRHGTLRLLTSPKRKAKYDSISSGNMASESGSSYYQVTRDEDPADNRVSAIQFKYNATESIHNLGEVNESAENESIVSSIVPSLTIKDHRDETEITPLRTELNSFNPTVPPRNKNRPASRIFSQGSLSDEEEKDTPELILVGSDDDDHKEHNIVEDLKMYGNAKIRNPSIISEASNTKSEAYYSAASNFLAGDDSSYISRPLPGLPNREDTLRRSEFKSQDNTTEYEDIGSIDTKGKQEEKPTKGKKRNNNSKNTRISDNFDIDTLNQLLTLTRGTLVGSEFANLGMKLEEKRLLERLVDSLSRLTADMILDPERYEEGLRRLEKAAKALDGF
ncbi:hypothetical protein KAFR_0C01120 [Kazachstania africana CBS 2517]|uniref:Protein NBA1 n=1 Tax=Kazachstania africana (strain ATCC 22294 / BCRC 22015 / CBS 2517 / CECT 1963 / NBRC 1671 / NRRL Y-8276) TaxID=1071382 RepID=H2ARV7_KAZAF|nr:hypothetical protein KAFR_0C01120 [Kazachstania africana CBS 2517]CCF57107.1 hypothetical protein KAFR_0C01120 [Kazachstania africana CBS 2517]